LKGIALPQPERFHPLPADAGSRSGASSGPRWADCLYAPLRQLIRRGGVRSVAAELLARGGMGVTAPLFWIRFQNPATRTATLTFL